MSLTHITELPTDEQQQAINDALDAIEANEPYKAALSDDEKNKFQTIAEDRYPYAVKAIKDLAPEWVDKMAPDVAAKLPQAALSMEVMEIYRPIISKLKTLLEYFTDGHHIAGYQGYEFLKSFYGEAQGLQARGVAGADTLVDELKKLWEDQGADGPQPEEGGDVEPQ